MLSFLVPCLSAACPGIGLALGWYPGIGRAWERGGAVVGGMGDGNTDLSLLKSALL